MAGRNTRFWFEYKLASRKIKQKWFKKNQKRPSFNSENKMAGNDKDGISKNNKSQYRVSEIVYHLNKNKFIMRTKLPCIGDNDITTKEIFKKIKTFLNIKQF